MRGRLLCINCYLPRHSKHNYEEGLRVMVFKATFNNISVILWKSVLHVEETGVLGENHKIMKKKVGIIQKLEAHPG